MKTKWKIIIPVAATLPLLITGGVFYFVTMDLTPNPYAGLNRDKETIFNRQLIRSLSDIKEKEASSFVIDDDSLNLLLNYASERIERDSSVGSFYVEIKGDNYKFFVESDFKFIKTRTIIDTTLNKTEDGYEFNVNSVKLGNLLARNLLKSNGYLSQIPFEKIFEEINLSIKVDRKNSKLIYLNEDIKNDYLRFVSEYSNDLFVLTSKETSSSYLIDEGIVIDSIYSDLLDNEKLIYHESAPIDKEVEDIVSNYESSLESGKSKNELESLVNSSFSSYKEKLSYPNISNIVKDGVKSHSPSEYLTPSAETVVSIINESDINKCLSTTDIIGRNYFVSYEHEYAYMLIDEFKVDIFSSGGTSYMNYMIDININGLKTRAIIETALYVSDNSFSGDALIKDVYYGKKILSSDSKELILDIFDEGINSLQGDKFISHQKGEKNIKIDFDSMIKNDSSLSEYKNAFYSSGGTCFLTPDKTNLKQDGKLTLKFKSS